jgi:hypothetical protein
MALVLPPSGVEEGIIACVTYAPPLPSIVAIVSDEEITGIIGSSIVKTSSNIIQTGSKTDLTLVSGGAS